MQDGACPTSLAAVDGWCTTLLDSKSRCSTSSFEHGIAGEVRRSSGTRGTVTYCDLIHCVNTCQYTCPDTCQYSQQITTHYKFCVHSELHGSPAEKGQCHTAHHSSPCLEGQPEYLPDDVPRWKLMVQATSGCQLHLTKCPKHTEKMGNLANHGPWANRETFGVSARAS